MHMTGYSKTREPRLRGAGANSANQGSKEAKPELEAPRKPPQPQPDPQDQPTEAKAKSEKSETSLRAEVEVSIISARGAILMETKDDSWKLGEDTNQYKLIVNYIIFSPECQNFWYVFCQIWDSRNLVTLPKGSSNMLYVPLALAPFSPVNVQGVWSPAVCLMWDSVRCFGQLYVMCMDTYCQEIVGVVLVLHIAKDTRLQKEIWYIPKSWCVMCPGLRCTPRTCSVEVGAAAKPKKIILQTEQQMGRSPVWDSKAQGDLVPVRCPSVPWTATYWLSITAAYCSIQ